MDTQARVPRFENLTAAQFREHVLSSDGPLVMSHATKRWRALSEWSDDYLREQSRGRRIRVVAAEQGHNRFDRARPMYVDMADYVDTLMRGGLGSKRLSAVQVPVMEQLPVLLDDIDWPDAISASDVVALNYWMAASGTFTHLHWDGSPGLLALARGRKKLTLFSPEQYVNMYPVPASEPWLIWSQVDVFSPDFQRFPKFSRARGIEVILNPGDTLYIPPYWWHFVENLETSIGVQFWLVSPPEPTFADKTGLTFYEDRTQIKKLRHRP